jgi:hypothetical protein
MLPSLNNVSYLLILKFKSRKTCHKNNISGYGVTVYIRFHINLSYVQIIRHGWLNQQLYKLNSHREEKYKLTRHNASQFFLVVGVLFYWWPRYYYAGGIYKMIKSCRFIVVSLLSMLKFSKDNNSIAVRRPILYWIILNR